MKQIDQDPSGYRVEDTSGRWVHRVDKSMCRWLGLFSLALAVMVAIASKDAAMSGFSAMMAFFAGALITLSLRSIDW